MTNYKMVTSFDIQFEADQCLCFRYTDCTVPLLPKSEISSLYLSSVAVQPGLCRTRSETRTLVFSERGSYESGVHGEQNCMDVLA